MGFRDPFGGGRVVVSAQAAAGAGARSAIILAKYFEGRSFSGWHHHVTLASVAHAHRVLGAVAERAASEPGPPADPSGRRR